MEILPNWRERFLLQDECCFTLCRWVVIVAMKLVPNGRWWLLNGLKPCNFARTNLICAYLKAVASGDICRLLIHGYKYSDRLLKMMLYFQLLTVDHCNSTNKLSFFTLSEQQFTNACKQISGYFYIVFKHWCQLERYNRQQSLYG